MENWGQVTHIWDGLENFRQLRRDIFHLGIAQINQASIDQFFPSYKFTIAANSKHKLIELIDQTINGASFKDGSLKDKLLAEKEHLEKVQEDLVLKRSMASFDYEFIFKEERHTLKGFVKIFNKGNPNHVGLLNWDDANDPILYLFELENGHLRLHINSGLQGLAVIQEEANMSYKWTHCLQEGYLEVTHAEHGSILMSRRTKGIRMENGNLAAIEASRLAATVMENGKTALENNIEFLKLHKAQLENLVSNR